MRKSEEMGRKEKKTVHEKIEMRKEMIVMRKEMIEKGKKLIEMRT